MRCLSAAAIVLISILAVAGLARGDLIPYSDRDTFNAQGTIVYNYDFEDVGTPNIAGIYYPGTPWTTHGVKYEATDEDSENLVLLPSCAYSPLSNVMTDNEGVILASLVDLETYNMLAMDVAAVLAAGDSTILLKTNLEHDGYSVDLTGLPLASTHLQKFFGFVTDTSGEYFTGFSIGAPEHCAIDNVTLGAVPEPGALTLLGIAVMGLGSPRLLRRKHRQ
jgi:hypothetical protein